MLPVSTRTQVFRKRVAHHADRKVLWAVLASILGMAAISCSESGGPEAALSQEQALRSLPYAQWVPIRETEEIVTGVTRHEEDRFFAGFNLYSPRHESRAFLVDMEGRVVHEWAPDGPGGKGWQHVEPDPGGGLFALVKEKSVIRVDRRGKVMWIRPLRTHHDIALSEGGEVYVMTRKRRDVTLFGMVIPILDDVIAVLDNQGNVTKEISIFELFGHQLRKKKVKKIRRWAEKKDRLKPGTRLKQGSPTDVFHTNSVEILDRPLPGISDKGDLLVSVREFNTVAILSADGRRILWSWGRGHLERQHDATLLPNGNILIFDNGTKRGYSRAVEVVPESGEISWSYEENTREDFFSSSRGGAQRLPNGNTLLTESNNGRVFEVTPGGEIVWEFFSPQIRLNKRTNPPQRQRAAIYRMRRILDPDFLRHLGKSPPD
jgi:hypothetical protein